MQPNVESPGPAARESPSRDREMFDEPAVPDAKVASGLVWPPVDGRTMLQEMAQGTVQLSRTNDGGWRGAIGNRWSLHSAKAAVFANVDAGRAELVQWARMHVANGKLISKHRCLVLAGDGQGRFRLWQLVRQEASLRARLEAALRKDAVAMAEALLFSVRTFLAMAARLATTTHELPLSLDCVAAAQAGPVYVGPVPWPAALHPARSWSVSQASDAMIADLGFAQPTLRANRGALHAELTRLTRDPDSYTRAEWHLLQKLVALTRQQVDSSNAAV